MEKITVIVPLGEGREFDVSESLNKQKDKLRHIIEVGPNTSENRNKGIKKARTELVAFVNGQTVLRDDWAEKVEDFFSRYPEIDILGGPQLNYEKDNFFAKTSGYALSSVFGAGGIAKRYKISMLDLDADESKITSANLICRKKVFQKVKFDESLYPGEDPKFISDAKKVGFNVAYSPSIVVYHRRRKNMKGLIKQVFNYGKTRPKKEKFRETLKRPYFIVPSLFLIYLMLLPTFLLINFLFILILFFYLVLNLLFSFYESIKNKNLNAFFILPVVFLSIHLSYGTGFLYGLLIKRISVNRPNLN